MDDEQIVFEELAKMNIIIDRSDPEKAVEKIIGLSDDEKIEFLKRIRETTWRSFWFFNFYYKQ